MVTTIYNDKDTRKTQNKFNAPDTPAIPTTK